MKRLLAYLFIVLGLGLTFSASAHAFGKKYCVLNNYDFNTFNNSPTIKITDIFLGYYKDGNKKKDNCGKGKKYRRVSKKNYDILQERYLNEINFKKKKEIQLSKKLKKSYKNDFGSWKFGHEICKVSVDSKWEYYFAKNNICAEKSHEKIDLKKSSYDFAWSQTPSRNLEKSHDFYLKFLGKKILTPEEENRNELKILKAELENLKKNQIAKAEPSQTREVAKENLNEIMSIAKKTSRWSNDSAEAELRSYKYHCITKDFKKVRRIGGCGFDIDARTFLDIKMVSEVIYNKYGKDPKLFFKKLLPIREEITQNYLDKTKTQIAKAEPSQTQKVVNEITYDWVAITKHPRRNKNFIATRLSTRKKAIDLAMMKCYKYVTNSLSKRGYNDCSLVDVYNEKNKNITQLVKKEPSQSLDFENYKNFKQWSILHKYDGRYFWNDSVNLNLKEAIAESAVDCVSQIKRYSSNLRVFPKDCKLNTIQIVSINNKKKIFKPSNTKELNKLIAKNLSLLDEKTSTKIVKKQKPKQEEFKPEKTNQDNEAPIITIAEAITVNDASYEIEGKVSDSSMNIFITVDGRTIPVKEGKFRIKRFSPVDEQIEIIATDQWGNRSQPKLVNITIDQQETIVADIFETLDPSKIKTRSNKNRVALIIGIEKYDQTPEASYANLDAKYFYEYVRKGFGVSKSNIKLLVDEDANLIKSLGTINKWLPGKIKGGKTELIIFFAGHGLASNDGKELYLLPQDSDPDLLVRTALSRTELFNEIIALNPKSVTMFLDTCYSGVSRDERTLLASARPVRIVADEQDTPNNFTIFSASQLDQISSGLKEANHGIFSYYLMKGLEGKADSNQDKKITNGELLAYMDENVSQKASELGRQQNPSLAGDPDKILMSYR